VLLLQLAGPLMLLLVLGACVAAVAGEGR